MIFNDHTTVYSIIRKACKKHKNPIGSRIGQRIFTNHMKPDEIYNILLSEHGNDPMSLLHLHAEQQWYKAELPYYKLWSGIANALLNIDLDKVPLNSVNMPMGALLIRMPEQPVLTTEAGGSLKLILAAKLPRGFVVLSDWGEKDPHGHSVLFIQQIDKSLGDNIDSATPINVHPTAEKGMPLPREDRLNAMKLFVGICLLSDDNDLIQPDVLSKDRSKYQRTLDLNLVEKAKRKGKFGFLIGNLSETSPHYRNPHLCLVWTGSGRKIPKVVLRKGSIVQRKKAATIPTGYTSPNMEHNDENI